MYIVEFRLYEFWGAGFTVQCFGVKETGLGIGESGLRLGYSGLGFAWDL